jgi:hypothetical protein
LAIKTNFYSINKDAPQSANYCGDSLRLLELIRFDQQFAAGANLIITMYPALWARLIKIMQRKLATAGIAARAPGLMLHLKLYVWRSALSTTIGNQKHSESRSTPANSPTSMVITATRLKPDGLALATWLKIPLHNENSRITSLLLNQNMRFTTKIDQAFLMSTRIVKLDAISQRKLILAQ